MLKIEEGIVLTQVMKGRHVTNTCPGGQAVIPTNSIFNAVMCLDTILRRKNGNNFSIKVSRLRKTFF